MNKTNTLRIEPYLSDIAEIDFVFWKIWIDDVLITETAYSFAWQDGTIELFDDIHIPIGYVIQDNFSTTVRVSGNYVLWFKIGSDKWRKSGKSLSNLDACIFDMSEYQIICDDALEKTPKRYFRTLLDDTLSRELRASEITDLLLVQYPFQSSFKFDVIYQLSLDMSFEDKVNLIESLKQALSEADSIDICDPPDDIITIQIGIDGLEFKECLWHVGKVDGKWAIQFERYPHFPLWLQFAKLEDVFTNTKP